MLCTQCQMHFFWLCWADCVFCYSLQFAWCLHYRDALGQSDTCREQSPTLIPQRTSFNTGRLNFVILKDYIQEDGWEPALRTGPQATGQAPMQAPFTQGPGDWSVHSGQPLVRPQPSVTFVHWWDADWDQGLPTQSECLCYQGETKCSSRYRASLRPEWRVPNVRYWPPASASCHA